jgi:hypothetical protein
MRLWGLVSHTQRRTSMSNASGVSRRDPQPQREAGKALLDPDVPDLDLGVHEVVAAAAQALAKGSGTGDGMTPTGTPN